MNKVTTRIAAALATASMTFAPIAAQAKTRAGDNQAVYSTSSAQPGVGRSAEGEEFVGLVGLGGILAALFGGLAIISVIVVASDDNQTGGGN